MSHKCNNMPGECRATLSALVRGDLHAVCRRCVLSSGSPKPFVVGYDRESGRPIVLRAGRFAAAFAPDGRRSLRASCRRSTRSSRASSTWSRGQRPRRPTGADSELAGVSPKVGEGVGRRAGSAPFRDLLAFTPRGEESAPAKFAVTASSVGQHPGRLPPARLELALELF